MFWNSKYVTWQCWRLALFEIGSRMLPECRPTNHSGRSWTTTNINEGSSAIMDIGTSCGMRWPAIVRDNASSTLWSNIDMLQNCTRLRDRENAVSLGSMGVESWTAAFAFLQISTPLALCIMPRLTSHSKKGFIETMSSQNQWCAGCRWGKNIRLDFFILNLRNRSRGKYPTNHLCFAHDSVEASFGMISSNCGNTMDWIDTHVFSPTTWTTIASRM